MTKNEVLDYVMLSPANTNRAVLSDLLSEFAAGGNKEEIELTATENKVYTPDTGKVYKKVTVNVPTQVVYPTLTVTEDSETEKLVCTTTGDFTRQVPFMCNVVRNGSDYLGVVKDWDEYTKAVIPDITTSDYIEVWSIEEDGNDLVVNKDHTMWYLPSDQPYEPGE